MVQREYDSVRAERDCTISYNRWTMSFHTPLRQSTCQNGGLRGLEISWNTGHKIMFFVTIVQMSDYSKLIDFRCQDAHNSGNIVFSCRFAWTPIQRLPRPCIATNSPSVSGYVIAMNHHPDARFPPSPPPYGPSTSIDAPETLFPHQAWLCLTILSQFVLLPLRFPNFVSHCLHYIRHLLVLMPPPPPTISLMQCSISINITSPTCSIFCWYYQIRWSLAPALVAPSTSSSATIDHADVVSAATGNMRPENEVTMKAVVVTADLLDGTPST